jgi:hypothetical protein
VTDARLPSHWLIDQRFDDLTPDEFHLYAAALMWSVSNRTEGVVPGQRLDRLPWRPDARCSARLEAVGLWRRTGDDWLILDFGKTQTSAKQLDQAERARKIDRERKSAKRVADAAAAARKDAESDDEGVSGRNSTRTSDRNLKERESARASREEEDLPPPSGFVSDDVKDGPDWPSVTVPGQRDPEPPQSFAIFGRIAADADTGP